MSDSNYTVETPKHRNALIQKSIVGCAIALLAIAVMIIPIQNPDASWGTFWMVKPFLMVTLAGVLGGMIYHLITIRFQNGWKKPIGIVLGLLVYIFGLWIGAILGLDGTLWN